MRVHLECELTFKSMHQIKMSLYLNKLWILPIYYYLEIWFLSGNSLLDGREYDLNEKWSNLPMYSAKIYDGTLQVKSCLFFSHCNSLIMISIWTLEGLFWWRPFVYRDIGIPWVEKSSFDQLLIMIWGLRLVCCHHCLFELSLFQTYLIFSLIYLSLFC